MSLIKYPLNILIADDHRLITDGLSKILEGEERVGVILTAHNGREAVEMALANDIDFVIMDINMPELNGIEATTMIKKTKPQVNIIVVSMISDAPVVSKLFRAGADGYLNKDTGKDELLNAMDKILLGEKYISAEISKNLLVHLDFQRMQQPDTEKPLTIRELEIVRFIAAGLTNKEIADRLFLSSMTVDTHRKNILAKLHLKNTASLVKYAADHKLI